MASKSVNSTQQKPKSLLIFIICMAVLIVFSIAFILVDQFKSGEIRIVNETDEDFGLVNVVISNQNYLNVEESDDVDFYETPELFGKSIGPQSDVTSRFAKLPLYGKYTGVYVTFTYDGEKMPYYADAFEGDFNGRLTITFVKGNDNTIKIHFYAKDNWWHFISKPIFDMYFFVTDPE
jgi:hypothetical protein